ncbi:MAG: mannose-1-phosphate guanylyltransferase/mannose-6-phosphate isomerase [Fretibacterium sp.]|nr:mannose-1-phosphate guanylyltransferase/mannose-6-phosphate isomerase [Fretibacterium sp.]
MFDHDDKDAISMPRVYGLILTGGSGTRLWPKSREDLPKQFLALAGPRTLLQESLLRMLNVVCPQNLYAVSGESFAPRVEFQAREVAAVSEGFVVCEPMARNTAPAILLGCEALLENGAGEEDLVIVAPSDHLVKDVNAFAAALQQALAAAEEGCLTTLGIVPDRPETGFGYIRRGRPRGSGNGYEVDAFVEKPDFETAQRYVESGEYFWNGGVFVFSLASLYRELRETSPDLSGAVRKGTAALRASFETLPSISFDYAVMEKTHRAAMVPMDAGWSDVGSWDALHDVLPRDERGNCLKGDVLLENGRNCFVDSQDRLTVLADVDDLILVDTPDVIFVTRRGFSQRVRDVARHLKERGRREVHQATDGSEPWGSYKVLCEEGRFRIRRLLVEPGKTLSLCPDLSNGCRWLVIEGKGVFSGGGSERELCEGESFFLPFAPKEELGAVQNPGPGLLELIEIQQGTGGLDRSLPGER